MPTYSYQCSDCSHVFDRMLRIADRDTPVSEACPSCSVEGKVQKLVGGAPLLYAASPTSVSREGKVPDSFKEVLQRIHERTPGSILNQTSPWVK